MPSLACPSCARKLNVADAAAGKRVRCPGCGHILRIPAPAGASVPAPRTVAGKLPARPARPPKPVDPGGEVTVGPSQVRDQTVTGPPNSPTASPPPKQLIDFLASPQSDDELGRLGPYRVLQVLGHGGMGVVFLAEDAKLNRKVALKAMLPSVAANENSAKRFVREAQAMAQVKHKHVATIHQVDEDRGVPYLAMEFLAGEPLDVRLKRESILPTPETLRIGREIAEGLAAAHKRGLIHRDIKPGNVWLESDEDDSSPHPSVKILDFGLARVGEADSQLTQSGAIVGTPAYMAPEQARGANVDARCDLFSLGVVLYRMATGQMPFKGVDTISTLMAIASDEPPPPQSLNKKISAEVSELILKLLAKDPSDRFQTALDVASAIAALESTSSDRIATRGPAKRSTIVRPPRRGMPWILLAAGILGIAGMALACLVVVLLLPGDVPEAKRTATVIKNAEAIPADPEEPPLPEPEPAIAPFDPVLAVKHQKAWAAYLKQPVVETSKIGIEMVLIPPGGGKLTQPWRLGKYEVTQGLFTRVMGWNPSMCQGEMVKGEDPKTLPVETVSWYTALELCNELSKLEKLEPYYEIKDARRDKDQIVEAEVRILGGGGYRLPTEKEWNNACRAGDAKTYAYGVIVDGVNELAWFEHNSEHRSHKVGGKLPNAFGVYDMLGNVNEWCWDETGPGSMQRASRGGGWSSNVFACSIGSRLGNEPSNRVGDVGIRVARGPSQGDSATGKNP
jgi:eukaryotic-like serine/threonine-protein kinase